MTGDAFDDIVKACRLFLMASQPLRLQILLLLESSGPLTANKLQGLLDEESRGTVSTALSKLRSEALVEQHAGRRDVYLINPAGRLIIDAYRLVSKGPRHTPELRAPSDASIQINPAESQAARFFHLVASAARLKLLLNLLDGPLPAAELRSRGGGSKDTRQIDFLLKASLICRVRADEQRGYALTEKGRRFAEFCSALNSEEATAAFFRVFTKPERIRLLVLLGDGEHCECHIPMALKISPVQWRKLLKDMESVGGLNRAMRGRWAHYALSDAARNLYKLIEGCPEDLPLSELQSEAEREFLCSLGPCEDA